MKLDVRRGNAGGTALGGRKKARAGGVERCVVKTENVRGVSLGVAGGRRGEARRAKT